MTFVNPGLLGPPCVFQRVFVRTIEASQDNTATPEELSLGQARSHELQRRIAPFMLRRTSAINEAYLPKCYQYVMFCRPTASQLAAYKRELYGDDMDHHRGGDPAALRRLFSGSSGVEGSQVLAVIQRLRQICNHANFVNAVCHQNA
jgi:SNF2 family DNA or RNA helicase